MRPRLWWGQQHEWVVEWLTSSFYQRMPYAYYVHCYAHRLQHAIVGAAKDVVPVTQLF
jgi:hypothetical protein